ATGEGAEGSQMVCFCHRPLARILLRGYELMEQRPPLLASVICLSLSLMFDLRRDQGGPHQLTVNMLNGRARVEATVLENDRMLDGWFLVRVDESFLKGEQA
ncbi:MAG: hypothetical protein VX500_07280, partial [Planctomycetota bacterium]|nr:hypothetical protein [Planctomycetota bacterium]